MPDQKIFGIGFHKTATSSLSRALNILGYRVCGAVGIHDRNIEKNAQKIAFSLVDKYDAFQDNPWPILYQELDQNYPGNKFILTLRPTDLWLKSTLKYFGSKSTPMRKWIYGVGYPKGHEDIYIQRYEKHNYEVIEYFKDRPEDLLVIDITQGEGWEKLCPFLGVDFPECEFPHLNKAEEKQKIRFMQYRKDIQKRVKAVLGLSEVNFH